MDNGQSELIYIVIYIMNSFESTCKFCNYYRTYTRYLATAKERKTSKCANNNLRVNECQPTPYIHIPFKTELLLFFSIGRSN